MNFTQLQAEVVTITNRPDLINETSLAVRRATQRAHNLESFPKDIVELNVSLAAPMFVGQIDLTVSPFVRFRAMKYLREYNAVHTGMERYLKPLEVDELADSYGAERSNIYYMAGNVVNWKVGYSSQATGGITGLTIGYYQSPDINPATFTSWIADLEPWVIIEDAATKVLTMTGQFDLANAVQQAALESRQLLIQNHLEGVGR